MYIFRAFFALTPQARAILRSQCASSIVFETVNPSTALWRSTKPLLHGLSASAVHILTFKFSQNVINSLLQDSPPLSTRILPGLPKIVIQFSNNFLTTSSFFLVQITHDEL